MAPLSIRQAPASPEADDMTLLREYVDRGCEASFARLVDRHINWVYSICRRGLKDPHLAEDATQAVFLILARRARTISPSVHLSGWLFKTCRFAVADARKREFRHQRRQDLGMRLGIERMNAAEAEPSSDAITPILDDALASLKETDRQVLMLHFYESMSIAEMGVVLGISAEGAKKRVTRALHRLREQFSRRKVAVSVGLLCTFFYARSSEAAPLGLSEAVAITALGQGPISIVAASIVQGVMGLMQQASRRLVRALLVAELAAVGIVGGLGVLKYTSLSPANQVAAAPLSSIFPLQQNDEARGGTAAALAADGQAPGGQGRWLQPGDDREYIHREEVAADASRETLAPSRPESKGQADVRAVQDPLKAAAPAEGSDTGFSSAPMGGGTWGGIGGVWKLPPLRPRLAPPAFDLMPQGVAGAGQSQRPPSLIEPRPDPNKLIAELFRLRLDPEDHVDLEHGLVFDLQPDGQYSVYSLDKLQIHNGYAQGYLVPDRYSPDEIDGFKQSWMDLNAVGVPEPGTGVLLVLPALMLLRRRRRG